VACGGDNLVLLPYKPWPLDHPRRVGAAGYALGMLARGEGFWEKLSDSTRSKVTELIWGCELMTAFAQHEITDLIDADLAGEDPALYNQYKGDIWLAGDDWPPLWRFFHDEYGLLRAWGPISLHEAAAMRAEGRA
jgi:hypothetical protein